MTPVRLPPSRFRTRLLAPATLLLVLLAGLGAPPRAGGYVTETSTIRWNDVGGIRWNDVGGIRWNDVGGIRWNDVGGIRWNDVGGELFTDAYGIRWNDVGGIRFNDTAGLLFDTAVEGAFSALDPELLALVSMLPDSSSIDVVVTYRSAPTASDLADLVAMGIPGGTIFRRLPMVVVNATKDQIHAIAALPAVRSLFANRTLSIFDEESRALIGMPEVDSDAELRLPGGTALTGSGVTIAVLDSGVDATHPDLPYHSKVVENVRLTGAVGSGPGFVYPAPIEGVQNTDLVLGHGTSVSSVAAGTGAASAGAYRGVAPGASILGLSAGDFFIINVLEGFDYVLDNQARFGIRVVNCSWGIEGFFDPDDPVNIATRVLYDAGITVVFASGNYGPSPDTLNPYSVAPWVIGVGSVRRDGTLSDFSSRGIFEELLYHPVMVAPGEGIIAANPVALGGVNAAFGVTDPTGGVVVPPAASPYYSAVSGTSFAAPHVAGVVALMLQARPSLSPREIKETLMSTATPSVTRDRSEVGAGRLDAWSALARTLDAGRPFGTYIPAWLDQRSYRIDHQPATVTQAIAPAGGSVTLPVSLSQAATAWQMTLAWGTLPGASDLDVTVFDSTGNKIAKSESLNGTSLFGRTEGTHLYGAVPREMAVEVRFKAGTGLVDQPFEMRQETAVAALTAFSDVAGLAQAVRERLALAVSRHVLEGRGSRFEPYSALARGELARSLALVAERPQRIPSSPTFPDLGPGDPAYPFVESVAGSRALHVLMTPRCGGAFKGGEAVSRLDFAVAAVRAAGREMEAQSRAGEALGLLDEASIPGELRGYVAVAREQGLIDTVRSPSGRRFLPRGSVNRLRAAGFLLRLLDLRGGTIPSQPPASVQGTQGGFLRPEIRPR